VEFLVTVSMAWRFWRIWDERVTWIGPSRICGLPRMTFWGYLLRHAGYQRLEVLFLGRPPQLVET